MSKRVAIEIDESVHKTVIFAVDNRQADTILKYILRDKVDAEFKTIRDVIKQNLKNREKYCKADVSKKANNMFEMRFTNNGRNDRIYCQEVHKNGKRYIVMCELYEGKKSQAIPNKIKSRIETMGGYEYEL